MDYRFSNKTVSGKKQSKINFQSQEPLMLEKRTIYAKLILEKRTNTTNFLLEKRTSVYRII